MPSRAWSPSPDIFQTRLQYMVRAEGYAAVQSRYGRSRRTIRRWERGETTPSADIRRRVSRSAREYTGTVVQGREGGRYSPERTIFNPDVVRMYEEEAQRTEQRRGAAIREARTPRQRAAARALPAEPDVDFYLNMDERQRRLIAAGADGWYYGPEGYDDWRAWRADYSRVSGRR